MIASRIFQTSYLDGAPVYQFYKVTFECAERDVEQNLCAAIRAYLKTARGQEIAFTNNGDFNWGDAIWCIPDWHWRKFGIVAVEPYDLKLLFSAHHDYNFWKENG